MDSNNKSQICPWCQTEIVWDPELGPEEACPHCLNELGGYRTVKLKLKQDNGDLSLEEDNDDDSGLGQVPDEDDGEELELDDLLDDYGEEGERDAYSEKVVACMDLQEYAPECSNCHELMLHSGVRRIGGAEFEPKVPLPLGHALLNAPYALDVFVCPSCFKTDEYLKTEAKEELVRALTLEQD